MTRVAVGCILESQRGMEVKNMTTNKVKAYRNFLGYSQREMSDLLGITLNSYRNKERGITNWKDEERIFFKKLLLPLFPGITVDSIFFCNDESQRGIDKAVG